MCDLNMNTGTNVTFVSFISYYVLHNSVPLSESQTNHLKHDIDMMLDLDKLHDITNQIYVGDIQLVKKGIKHGKECGSANIMSEYLLHALHMLEKYCRIKIWKGYHLSLHIVCSWWRHQMETFYALLAFCAGNSPVSGEFPAQRPVTGSFDVFFDLRLNKRMSKQWWGWWFETPSCPLWRHCNVFLRSCCRKALPVLLWHSNYWNRCWNVRKIPRSSRASLIVWRKCILMICNIVTLSTLLALCEGNPLDSPHKRPVMWDWSCQPEQTVVQTVKLTMIWAAMTIIWRHCNDIIFI